MTDTAPFATSVLISIRPIGDDGAGHQILGRTLAERQIEYAYSLGCDLAVLVGGGGKSDAIAARLRAEELGLKVLETSGPHGLANCLADEERLLVLQSDLLPSLDAFVADDADDGCILILPASAGAEAGFERIDLARGWAGALVLPGHLLENLHNLPEDAECAPALLRIALQARLPEIELNEDCLSDGSWCLIGEDGERKLVEERWLAQHIEPSASAPASRSLIGHILQRFGNKLLDRPAAAPLTLAASMVLAVGAVVAAWFGYGAASFGVIALAALLLEFSLGLQKLIAIPVRSKSKLTRIFLLIDLAILACGVLSVDGAWYRQAFSVIVLLAAFHAAPHISQKWSARLRDRVLICGLVAIIATFAPLEAGIMLAALLLMVLLLTQNGFKRG